MDPRNERVRVAVVLGGHRGEVSGYISPAVADDLSTLPTTYIDAGSAEVFRDEVVDYASRIWAAGGQAELHVWAGGSHGFDAMFPQARLSALARRTRADWLARILDSSCTAAQLAAERPDSALTPNPSQGR
jgi:acetyl esterase/lipase